MLLVKERHEEVVLLWRWWSARNKMNAGERRMGCSEVCSSVMYQLTDFEKLGNQAKGDGMAARPKWLPPAEGVYKLNVDASFHATSRDGGWGYVARNDQGEVLDIGAGKITNVSSVLHAEALAALRGLE
ncbi:hypothetical protein EJB05_53472, partial [Eragrostis curvula]